MADWQLVLAGGTPPVAAAFLTALAQAKMQRERDRSARQQALMDKREAAYKDFIRLVNSIPRQLIDHRGNPEQLFSALDAVSRRAIEAATELSLYGGSYLEPERTNATRAISRYIRAITTAMDKGELQYSSFDVLFNEHLLPSLQALTAKMSQLLERG